VGRRPVRGRGMRHRGRPQDQGPAKQHGRMGRSPVRRHRPAGSHVWAVPELRSGRSPTQAVLDVG